MATRALNHVRHLAMATLAVWALVGCGGGDPAATAADPAQQANLQTVFPSTSMQPLHELGPTLPESEAIGDTNNESQAGTGDRTRLAAATPAAPRYMTPALIRSAYGLPSPYVATDPALLGAGQTVAVITAFANPGISQDLEKFTRRFVLPACTDCFSVVNTRGGQATPEPPATNRRWAIESSLDVQWVRAIAPQARIVLVQAASAKYADVLGAARYAATVLKADVISMSFGGAEWAGQAAATQDIFSESDASFVAASGDDGFGVLYPASSPRVLAVGGTTLAVSATGVYQSEVAWTLSGGGLSAYEQALPIAWPLATPAAQTDAWRLAAQAARGRPVPDVAYAADPANGFLIYATTGIGPGYVGIVGGTSAGAPQWAALTAVANARRIQAGKAPFRNRLDAQGRPADLRTALMQISAASSGDLAYAGLFNDITDRSNGNCGVLCNAGPGWDLVTGLGTPKAGKLIEALVRW